MQRQAAAGPAVSVVIPAYRASGDIGDALDSIVQQTCHDLEVIVVNDGSPDTDELETALTPYRDRISYITQENRGRVPPATPASRRPADGMWPSSTPTTAGCLNFCTAGGLSRCAR